MELNNREIAIVLWSILALGFFSRKKDLRDSFASILKNLVHPVIMRTFLMSLLYTLLSLIIVWRIGLWNAVDIKTFLLWFAFVAVPTLSQCATDRHVTVKGIFKNWVNNNIRFFVVVEFMIGLYPMSLITELIFVPISTLLGMTLVFSQRDQEHEKVAQLLNWILIGIGLFLFVRAMFYAGYNVETFLTLDTLKTFLIVPLLSLLFIPFGYAINIYAMYDNIFARIKIRCKSSKLVPKLKRKCIVTFKRNTRLASEWVNYFFNHHDDSSEFLGESLKLYASLPKRFNTSKIIDPKEGWSPYEALGYLAEVDMHSFIYQPFTDMDWGGETNNRHFGDDKFSSYMSYRVDGNEDIAWRLKLGLDVKNKDQNEKEFIEVFSELVAAFSQKAIGADFPKKLTKAILQRKSKTHKSKYYRIRVETENYDDFPNFTDFRITVLFHHRIAHDKHARVPEI